jgi:hypothetical protein
MKGVTMTSRYARGPLQIPNDISLESSGERKWDMRSRSQKQKNSTAQSDDVTAVIGPVCLRAGQIPWEL